MNAGAKLILACGAIAGCYLALAALVAQPDPLVPELVTVEPGLHDYRISGEFLKDGNPVDAPIVPVRISGAIEIMKYQVSAAEYASCVADEACDPPLARSGLGDDLPATGVSFKNALDYAAWLSRKTDMRWRLPSDEEWSYAAGSRFVDDALGTAGDPDNPSALWLLKYRKYSGLESDNVSVVRPRGFFGPNEKDIHDLSGNVWEWTTTCYNRARVGEDGRVLAGSTANCGVRIAEGQHRAYITFFVQDARGGGCAAGAPPDHLGFRLVRETPPLFSVARLRRWLKMLQAG
jgi:formylglycine-generating enzyme required for sulfatase activity